MSESASGIERPYGVSLPDGIKHLHGALYLVRFDLIQVADPESVSQEEGHDYEFRNARTLTQKGQATLFDKRESQKMRESIRDKTLMSPFVCRWKFEGEDALSVKKLLVQLVGGERRYRGVHWLRSKRELVKDPSTARLNDKLEYEYDFRPADQVYEYVLCQIYAVNNDIDALALSYTENDCRVQQGDGADVAMVQELRRCRASDERIMAAMSKDEKWLRDTDALITGLTENALNDLLEDRIDREGALELLKIRERHGDEGCEEARVLANEAAQKEYLKRYERHNRRIDAAMTEKEFAEAAVEEAKFQGEGVEEAQESVAETTQKVNRTLKERDQEKPTTSGNHVRSASRQLAGAGTHRGGGSGGSNGQANRSTMLRSPKVKECFIEPMEHLIRVGGKSPEIDDQQADVDALTLALKLIRAINDGDSDGMEIIRLHYKNKR